ncbi:MAG: NAD-dependent epimerase/dehydratase family protein [Candidatus Kariarchaeaceae archaeon]
MKAAITGATGFLGQYLISELLGHYDDISVLVRTPTMFKNDNIQVFTGDIRKPTTLQPFLKDVDHLYHAAAMVGSWPRDPMDGYYQINVDGTKNLIEEAMKSDLSKIIYTSSYFALGETGETERNEDWDKAPDFKHPYVNTKYQAGKLVEQLVEDFGYPVTSVFPTVIIGEGMDNPVSSIIIDYINGKLPGLPAKGGSMGLNFVLADSVAKGHLQAADRGSNGEKYILGGENISLREFLMMFGEALNLKPPRSIPNWVSKSYAWLLELKGNPGFTRADLEVSKRSYVYDSSKAVKKLGYKPESIHTVIPKLLKEYMKSGKLNTKGEKSINTYLQIE